MPGAVIFKQADQVSEFEQIHRLNYRTFSEEVGQYTPDGSGRLVDRFHDRNLYCIAVRDGRVLGMVAANDQPPFSVESRLPNPAILTGLGGPLLEVRLLALDPDCRDRLILAGMLWELYRHARHRRYSHLIISGITAQVRMYGRIGFQALGPAVGSGAASFVPMALPLHDLPPHLARYTSSYLARQERASKRPMISLMPGPVEIHPAVRQAFSRRPVSHRSTEFVNAYERVRAALRALSGGMNVAILTGSGTTANDSVAMHLRAAFNDAHGLVLINGEFGERIARQASRAGLRFDALRWGWGEPWDLTQVAAAFRWAVAWVWVVHLETSTGVLNPLTDLLSLASSLGGPVVAADCISSLGAVPLPPDGLWMATGVSGKSIGSYAGLSFVFASARALEETRGIDLPASLDVHAAVACAGSQFTMASPGLFALERALDLNSNRFAEHRNLGRLVRTSLKQIGIQPLAPEPEAAPCVTTFADPDGVFVDKAYRAGFELGGESQYLRDRGWAQIATMGAINTKHLDRLFGSVGRAVNRQAGR